MSARPAPDPELSSLRDLAERAARIGGQLAREAMGAPPDIRLKPDRSEVTEIDMAAERAVAAEIRRHRPDDALLGEEGTTGPHPTGAHAGALCWAIDPLDGTRNLVRGLPAIACSVAALRGGTPVAAAVYDPLHDTLYSAHTGSGLLVDGRPRAPRGWPAESSYRAQARVLAAIPSLPDPVYLPAVRAMLERYVVRTFGSAALHLAWVADGRVDVAFQDNPKLWDVAAGWLLVRESGKVVTRPDGSALLPIDVGTYRGENLPLIAGGPDRHAELLALVAACA